MPPLRGEDDAGRRLVRRREHDDADAGRGERLDVDPVRVDRDGHGLGPGPRGVGRVPAHARVLEGEPAQPAAREDAQREVEPLRVAVADHDPVGVGVGAADAAEVRGEHRPQLGAAALVPVAEFAVRCPLERRSIRGQPLFAGKGRVVREVGPQVVAPVGVGGERARRGLRADRVGDERRRVPAELQVALRPELRVGGDHQAARDPELRSESARRWQRRAGAQPAGAHCLAELALELRGERSAVAAALERDQQLGSLGPLGQLVHKITIEVAD